MLFSALLHQRQLREEQRFVMARWGGQQDSLVENFAQSGQMAIFSAYYVGKARRLGWIEAWLSVRNWARWPYFLDIGAERPVNRAWKRNNECAQLGQVNESEESMGFRSEIGRFIFTFWGVSLGFFDLAVITTAHITEHSPGVYPNYGIFVVSIREFCVKCLSSLRGLTIIGNWLVWIIFDLIYL